MVMALKEVNFKIGKGETVAFIGENGSGKSTLLKLLGGIYTPDEGHIAIDGKISALLDLGVGFHPDLTGEENIYLNGSMLGFDHKEMKKKFDERTNPAPIDATRRSRGDRFLGEEGILLNNESDASPRG
jgi:ABC-2 type transport system ATP-binding protein/lipopolysaccharide transport system ATP-binding protein